MSKQVFELVVLVKDFHSIVKVRDLLLRGKCLEVLKNIKVDQRTNVVYDLSLGLFLEGQAVVKHSVYEVQVKILVERHLFLLGSSDRV
jgi:hypothetical protein